MTTPRPRPADSGARGEDAALAFLRRRGLRLVARNLRTRHGEIDLLMRRGRHYAAIEVKARREHPAPERTVAPEQIARLQRSLESLGPGLRPPPRSLCIDIVAVRWCGDRPAEVRHFPEVSTVSSYLDRNTGTRSWIGPPDSQDRRGPASRACYAWAALVGWLRAMVRAWRSPWH